jgi:uncharacterized secreted protein with C-terminal beta-propeller domain
MWRGRSAKDEIGPRDPRIETVEEGTAASRNSPAGLRGVAPVGDSPAGAVASTAGASAGQEVGRRKPFAGPHPSWVPALALAVATVGVPAAAQAATAGGAKDASGAGGLTRFANCGAFTDYLRRTTEGEVGAYGFGGGQPSYRRAVPMTDGANTPAMPPDAVGNSPTGTNVQERGVDEPDVAKVDGSSVYALTGGRLTVVDTTGSKPRLRGTLTFPAGTNPQELLVLTGHRVLVIGNSYVPADEPGGPGPVRVQPGGIARPQSNRMIRPIRPGANMVDLTVLNVADPAVPRIDWVEQINGAYLSARLHDGVARIVLSSAPHIEFQPLQPNESAEAATARNRATVRAAKAEDFLPTRRVLDRSGQVRTQGPLLNCSDVSRPDSPSGTGLISVLTIDTRAGNRGFTEARGTGVVANGELVYSSADRLYVATTQGGWNSTRPQAAASEQPAAPNERRTAIHAFDTTGRTTTSYRGSGSVPGYLLGRWAFSEHQGYLRVATTTGEPWAPPSGSASQSSVVVLAERSGGLREVGAVSGLGQGERIRGIRWFDDLAAVVTFRQTDPLYLVDLSTPTSPQVRGELKLTGYSAYLHPTGAGRLLGVGQSADPEGHLTGLQAQEFDVSQPTHPSRTGDVDLGRGSTNLEYDSRAFTYLTSRQLAVLPAWITEKVACPPNAQCVAGPPGGGGSPGFVGEITVPAALGISVDAHGELHRAGKFIGDSMILRVLPMGDRLVAVTESSVYVLDPVGLKPLGAVRTAPEQPTPQSGPQPPVVR